jgi:hypothetical protein
MADISALNQANQIKVYCPHETWANKARTGRWRDSARFTSIFPWASTRTGWLRVFPASKQNPRPPTRK